MRSPMVPPIADNMSTNFAALSLMILLKIGVSKYILTTLRLFFHWKSGYNLSMIKWLSQLTFITFEFSLKVCKLLVFVVLLHKFSSNNFRIGFILSFRIASNKNSSTLWQTHSRVWAADTDFFHTFVLLLWTDELTL